MSTSRAYAIGGSLYNIAKGTTQFVPNGLSNPRKGMWVDEVRFMVTMAGAVASRVAAVLHDACRFSLKVGKTELTGGYVGMCLAAGVRDWSAETTMQAAYIGTPFVENLYGTTGYAWRFPKPFFLPQNGVLDIGIQYKDDLGFPDMTLNVDVVMLGREVDLGMEPKTTDVPFCVAWYGDPLESSYVLGTYSLNPLSIVTAANQQSSSADLRNPFSVPLNVTRLTATQWGNASQGALSSENANAEVCMPEGIAWIGGAVPTLPSLVNNIGQNSPPYMGTRMQIFDQQGQPIVRDPASPGSIFAYADRAWRVDAKLPPNGYYLVDADVALSSVFYTTRLAVGMIGYRTIPTAELGVA